MQKRDYQGIHDRFLRDHVFRGRVIENNRDENVCRACGVHAEQDHTFQRSESEYFHYRQNWWISHNNSGNNTQPVRKRSDFNQALSTLNRPHQEVGGEQIEPIPHWKYKQWKTGIEFVLYLVGMAKLLVVFPRNHRKSRKSKQSLVTDRGNPLSTVFWLDLDAPRHAQYMQTARKIHQNTVYWVDIRLAEKKGLKFYQTRSNAIIHHNTLPSLLYPKGISDGNWRNHS